ncbi:hypothetical protein EYR41_007755 [Orbilia oligospora]|uniref:Uncharacterized protein n=1 Tax=Orbilia oligospora TaxID=2813651 RepID=A0A7C8KAL1_ORBOL|nr:hypothetical protein TWF751_008927 [Orbilia oligospora]TGJ66099.1 hypothetical protein EYR41_007755 [Orbilia oligospora]
MIFFEDNWLTSWICSHLVYTLRLNGDLFLAPVEMEYPKLKVLDLGTGNGIWCIDMAHAFPQSEIIGNDLSPIQPTYVPPNVQFEIDDFNDEWVHPANHFDFIHGRALYGSVTSWDQLLRKVLHALKPGGWWESVETMVEFQCDDGSLPEDSAVKYWVGIMRIACERAGTSFDVAGRVKEWCEAAGFEEVTQRVYKLPIGPWPKDKSEKTLGSYNLANMLSACDGFSLHLLTKFYGMSVPELNDLMDRVKAEMKNKKIHSYFRMWVCYARKPEAPYESRPSSRGSTIRPPTYDLSGGETTDCASITEEYDEDEEDDTDAETSQRASPPPKSIYHGRRGHRGH